MLKFYIKQLLCVLKFYMNFCLFDCHSFQFSVYLERKHRANIISIEVNFFMQFFDVEVEYEINFAPSLTVL